MEDRQILRSSDFMHERAFSILLHRYQAHSLRVHLCRIQGRQRNRQLQRHGRVGLQINWKEELKCRQKLVFLFYSSRFLVQFVKTPPSVTDLLKHAPLPPNLMVLSQTVRA